MIGKELSLCKFNIFSVVRNEFGHALSTGGWLYLYK